MKLEIYKAVNDYYLRIGGAIDYKIAEILNIPIEEYNQILIDNGAHRILYLNDEIDIGYEPYLPSKYIGGKSAVLEFNPRYK